jgi:hypothetical protein
LCTVCSGTEETLDLWEPIDVVLQSTSRLEISMEDPSLPVFDRLVENLGEFFFQNPRSSTSVDLYVRMGALDGRWEDEEDVVMHEERGCTFASITRKIGESGGRVRLHVDIERWTAWDNSEPI